MFLLLLYRDSTFCNRGIYTANLYGGTNQMRINISLNKELTDQIKKIKDQENRQSDADTLRALIKEALKIREQK
jgi:hypothetical protein